MTDFRQLKNALRTKKEAERQAAREKEQERRYLARAAQLKRSLNENAEGSVAAIAQLEDKARRASARHQAALRTKSASAEALGKLWVDILPLTDPRQNIQRWSSDLPILMFPYRVETRFKKVRLRETIVRDELWLRIYPDDCLIDTFEEDLTDMERKNARRYWAYHWAAIGDEEKEKEAWRELVVAHGSGRAGYIIQKYRPLNEAEQPPNPAPVGEFYLTIPAQENEPTGADAQAVADFWRDVFLQNESVLNASELAKNYAPANLKEVAPKEAEVKIVFVRFSEFGEENSKPFSWSEAPKAKLLPERFVFLGYNYDQIEGVWRLDKEAITPATVQGPLTVGPNPTAPQEEQFQETEDGDLIVPEEMRWMTDFGEALAKGMAMRIPLEPGLADSGFDRVFVLGLRLGSTPDEAKAEMEELIEHHLSGRSGFSIIPQGTPTNNTDDCPSGFSRTDDPEESFPVFVKKGDLFELTENYRDKTDGQWLAEWLGLDMDVFQKVPNADQTDQAEAKAMNLALWPATMGYWMQRMMDPVFRNGNVIEKTKRFFTRYVSGRGHIPSVRIGKQPYGILQASAHRKLEWLQSNPVFDSTVNFQQDTYLTNLYDILLQLNQFWRSMAAQVPHVGREVSDPQQQLLDIVGLHPGSVEYYARLGHSWKFLHNYYTFVGLQASDIFTTLKLDPVMAAKSLLASMGYHGKVEPKIFEKYYRNGQNRLKGPIVDDRPVLESEIIRAYTEEGKNYIGWLIDAIGDYEGMLHPQNGLTERPRALLYKLLRHALMEEFGNAGHRARLEAQIITPTAYQQALAVEPEFIHVEVANETSESRVAHLLEVEPVISAQPLAQYLGLAVKENVPETVVTRELREMERALEKLENVPTARLERLLAEHVDTCTYRHDAWVQGLLHHQLERMHGRRSEQEGRGLYLGGYAWLENLRPDNKIMTPVRGLSEELSKIFQREGDIELTRDNTNQGYIHAPSLNHAVTAAVLRNGYLSEATPTQPDLLTVNLSSERVRLALETLEGIRNGQSLGALLGYRFERKLHEEDPAMFVFTYQLRKKFPLVANQIKSTKDTTEEEQEAIAARNVVNGYALLKKGLQEDGQLDFSFLNAMLTDPAPNGTQRTFIEETIRDLLDIHDTLSDLGIAESVHQIVQGNYERAASTMDAFSNATFPQVPDVVVTPRSGVSLTHRVGLQLDGQATPDLMHTPRARTEPAVNDWLLGILPNLSAVAVSVIYTNPGDPVPALVTENVSLQDIGFQPLDLVYISDFGSSQALSALDERILKFIFAKPEVHAHATISIEYTTPIDDVTIKATVFELAPLLRSLRLVVLTSRPLFPSDAQPPGEASTENEPVSVLNRARINDSLPDTTNLDARIAAWAGAFPNIDQQLSEFVDVFSEMGLYGLTESGFGFVFNARQEIYRQTFQNLDEYLSRWEKRVTDFDQIMGVDLPDTTTDEERIDLLRRAEALVSTTFISLTKPPNIPQFQLDVEAKGVAFKNKKLALENLRKNPPAELHQFMADLTAELLLTDFDANDLILEKEENAIARFQQDLLDKATILRAEVQIRLDAANAQLAAHDDAAATPEVKLKALQKAGKVLFGEDFVMVPHFQLSESHGLEWQNSLDAQSEMLSFQHGKDLFPVDTWFHGSARVRERMHHFENVYLLLESFGKNMQDLVPVQFPYRKWVPDSEGAPAVEEVEPWLALEYPANFQPDEEKLLYTAAYVEAFNPSQAQCGLLIDEWTEVIPTQEETTGLTFHYDRPNTEAPQAWLLVTPSRMGGEWEWGDLLDALHQTLDLAKQRAVEPVQVENTPLGVFSPATVFPVTPWSITATLNLSSVNNQTITF